jgi:hypothetical protein
MQWATRWALLAALSGCGGATRAPSSARNESAGDGWHRLARDGISLAYRDDDAAGAPGLLDLLVQGRARVEAFFGAEFPQAIAVYVYPDRDSLTAHWREAWRMPALETECWMVASGEADELTLLSPRVWASEACEHDAGDRVRTAALLTHELVHVFHGQHVTGRSFVGMDDVGWFVEGLATHASGQLELGYLASAAEAIAAGKDPIHLREAWSGKYRYGVCGSIVGRIDGRLGRDGLRALLRLRTEAELLAAIGLTEAALLADWKQAIVEGASTVSITPPWSITYHDGSGNGYRLWQNDAVAHFEYTPVTPAMSSSGTYSGGAPARGDLTAAQVRELWTSIDALARETSLHANARAKGTGAFTTTTPTASNTFLIRSGDRLHELDAALARIRLP